MIVQLISGGYCSLRCAAAPEAWKVFWLVDLHNHRCTGPGPCPPNLSCASVDLYNMSQRVFSLPTSSPNTTLPQAAYLHWLCCIQNHTNPLLGLEGLAILLYNIRHS
ncbi:hypothetical protein KIL84_013712 [Mauremys mutica]|uniref:Uncharacterized protein n=1 Tax=Mauremys mutica TaxID=74926 RepID=A0A9D4AND5_9SAUR|nr:hypothetical protein KIL84_013712 [Mauremys mutica]